MGEASCSARVARELSAAALEHSLDRETAARYPPADASGATRATSSVGDVSSLAMRWSGLDDAALDRRLNVAFFVFGLIKCVRGGLGLRPAPTRAWIAAFGAVDRLLRVAFRVFELTASSNSAYVVFLSAAQALVAGAVPTGVVLFAAITPALLAKLCWPFVRCVV